MTGRDLRVILATRRPDLLHLYDAIVVGNTAPLPDRWYSHQKSLVGSTLAGMI